MSEVSRTRPNIWFRLRKRLGLYYVRCVQMKRAILRVRRTGSYISRTYLINEEKKLIYVPNNKVASSSIKASVQDLGPIECYHDVTKILRTVPDYRGDIDLANYADYYKFSFVRNPFARLASCYRNKYQQDLNLEGAPRDRSMGDRMYFDIYLMGYIAKDEGFKAFARKVSKIPDAWSDRHFASQSFLLEDAKGNMVADFVGRLEDLPDAYKHIEERFGVAPLPHYNQTSASPASEKWMDLYDLETAQLVYERFRRDVEQFRYQQDYERLVNHIKAKS